MYDTAFCATLDNSFTYTADNMIASTVDDANDDTSVIQLIPQLARQLTRRLTDWANCMCVSMATCCLALSHAAEGSCF